MYTADLQLIIFILTKYEEDLMNYDRQIKESSWWERIKIKKKRRKKTTQQQKSLKITKTRIEPVEKIYREVCFRLHQPNSSSKGPWTCIEHILAYCRVGKKHVGCTELLVEAYKNSYILLQAAAIFFVSHLYHALERTELVKITVREFLDDILNTNWINEYYC